MSTEAIPLLLWCPLCGERHVDTGEFATKLHHTHACQGCGNVWRPGIVNTVGVSFLSGFKNEAPSVPSAPSALEATSCGVGEDNRFTLQWSFVWKPWRWSFHGFEEHGWAGWSFCFGPLLFVKYRRWLLEEWARERSSRDVAQIDRESEWDQPST